MECSICLLEIDDADKYITICNHQFHLSCIHIWISITKHKGTCPLCREQLNVNKILSFTNKDNANIAVNIDELLKLDGIQKQGNYIIINISSPNWVKNIKNIIAISYASYGKHFKMNALKLGGNDIIFRTGLNKYKYTNISKYTNMYGNSNNFMVELDKVSQNNLEEYIKILSKLHSSENSNNIANTKNIQCILTYFIDIIIINNGRRKN